MSFKLPPSLGAIARRAAATHPTAAAYLERLAGELDFGTKSAILEAGLRHGELWIDLLDEVLSDLLALHAKYGAARGDDLAAVLAEIQRLLGGLPHDQTFHSFDEVLEQFYRQRCYPLLEHAIYLSSIGLDRLAEVLRLADQVPREPAGVLADLGVGPAVIFTRLLARFPSWKGEAFDVSPPCLEYAQDILRRRKIPKRRATVMLGDARSLAVKDGHFRLVVATEIVEHVPDPKALLAEISRMLAPDGWLIASTPIELPWGPHLSVFSSEDEVRALFSERFLVEELVTHPLGGSSALCFGRFRRRS